MNISKWFFVVVVWLLLWLSYMQCLISDLIQRCLLVEISPDFCGSNLGMELPSQRMCMLHLSRYGQRASQSGYPMVYYYTMMNS